MAHKCDDITMLKTLHWNDQAKQRYFNVSRAIIGLKRIADYERDVEMDDATLLQIQNALGNTKQPANTDKAVETLVDVVSALADKVALITK